MPSPKIEELQKKQAEQDRKLEAALKSQRGNPADQRTPSADEVFAGQSPFARKGESAMGSRGFQYQRLLGLMAGILEPEQCKVEMDVVERLRKNQVVGNGYRMTGGDRFVAPSTKGFLCPLSADMLLPNQGGEEVTDEFRYEIKSLCIAGVPSFDRDEAEWLMRKTWTGHQGKTAQSWIDETLGGSLVAPPQFGELIQLLRNKDALINAGARVEALPPSGRLKLPRQTTPTTGYHIGENTQITSSTFGTGFLELSGKKVAALVTLPNELIRYASPASEAILRADMTKTLSLTADYQLLYGEGSDVYPLGLANTPNIATVTPSDSSGSQLAPQDLFSFISAIEANNGEFQGWILRPELFYSFVQARAGVYNGSAIVNQGQFVYDQFRQLGMGFPKLLAGYNAVTTPQVSITRGSGTGTTVFGGQWDDFIIAMFGSIEFAQATQGDTAFANDQTVVRAILSYDGAARHPGVFAIADGVNQAVGV